MAMKRGIRIQAELWFGHIFRLRDLSLRSPDKWLY